MFWKPGLETSSLVSAPAAAAGEAAPGDAAAGSGLVTGAALEEKITMVRWRRRLFTCSCSPAAGHLQLADCRLLAGWLAAH